MPMSSKPDQGVSVMKIIRLLIVDDEDVYRNNIARLLANRNIEARQAVSGEDCLAVLEKHPMDVVVLDVKMPGMGGIITLDRIKKAYPATEVILLTGQATTKDGVDGIKTGAFDYLSKPVEIEHLVNKIGQAFDKVRQGLKKQREIEYRARMQEQMIATERLAALGTQATGVAHEINNPLAIAKQSVAWLKLILAKEEMAVMPRRADIEKGLTEIEAAINRARNITHQLLASVQKSKAVHAEINVSALVREAVELTAADIGSKKIEVVQQVDPVIENIWSDPSQLRQVLINLLGNAIHAIRDEGIVSISVALSAATVIFTVKDTGMGIPGENLTRIFEPFFSTKSPGQGTGLGLYVTRSIVDRLGGEIQVESHLGKGSEFKVRLPHNNVVEKK